MTTTSAPRGIQMAPAPAGPKTANLRVTVGEALVRSIVQGTLQPGDLVTVPALAAEFAVSPTPVREAILDLEQRGFVEPVANKGFRVTSVSFTALREIIEVRQLLEAPAMVDLIGRVSSREMAVLRAMATEVSVLCAGDDVEAFIDADGAFHLELLRVHGNSKLLATVRGLREQTRMVALAKRHPLREPAATCAEHHTMLDLIESGDADALRMLVVHHLERVLHWWVNAD